MANFLVLEFTKEIVVVVVVVRAAVRREMRRETRRATKRGNIVLNERNQAPWGCGRGGCGIYALRVYARALLNK